MRNQDRDIAISPIFTAFIQEPPPTWQGNARLMRGSKTFPGSQAGKRRQAHRMVPGLDHRFMGAFQGKGKGVRNFAGAAGKGTFPNLMDNHPHGRWLLYSRLTVT